MTNLHIDTTQCSKMALYDTAMGTVAIEQVIEYGVTREGDQTVKFISKDQQVYIALVEKIRIMMYFTPESIMRALHVSQ